MKTSRRTALQSMSAGIAVPVGGLPKGANAKAHSTKDLADAWWAGLTEDRLAALDALRAKIRAGNRTALRMLVAQASEGDPYAQNCLGALYRSGKGGVERDWNRARQWFHKAAKQGSAHAQENFDYFILRSQYPVDSSARLQAMQWFRKAEQSRRKAAEQGNAMAQYEMGEHEMIRPPEKGDVSQAIEWYRKAAEQGHIHAQYHLGECYAKGKDVAQDWSQAAQWWHKAAQQGHVWAQYNLGCLYEAGSCVEQDWGQALQWLRKAAKQGHANAQYKLGECYAEGNGIAQDWGQAVQWFRQAAKQGHCGAEFKLGECYAEGNGVAQNWRQTVQWYHKAARGRPRWQCRPGEWYAEGKGVRQDLGQAIQWWRKAAEQRDTRALFNLGALYAVGQSVPHNTVAAYALHTLAAARTVPDKDAANSRAALAKNMTAQEIETGEALFREMSVMFNFLKVLDKYLAAQGSSGG